MGIRLASLGLIGLLGLQPLASAWSATTEPAAVADAAARKHWDPVLTSIGVKEGQTLQMDQYLALVRKLAAFPPVATKIRQASTKPITVQEWAQIMRGLGISPKPVMNDSDWIAILTHAGIDISHGTSPSLAQLSSALPPVAVPAVSTPTIASPAATRAGTAPVVVLSPAVVAVSTATENAVRLSTAAAGPSVAAPLQGMPILTVSTSAATSVVLSTPALAAPASATPSPVALARSSETAPVAPALSAAPTTPTVSLELRGLDINEVLKTIARQGQLNLITNSNVHGSVSISMKNVDLWEALRTILEANDLAYAYDGTILRVMTAADYEKLFGTRFDDKTVIETVTLQNVKASAMSKYLDPIKTRIGKILVYDYNNTLILVDTPESNKRMKELAHHLDAQLSVKIYALNYIKVDELLPKIQPLVTKDIGDVEIDKRTNRMIVMDFPDHFGPIDAIVTAFDRKHRAVLIEAKILQITLNDSHQMGVNWQYIFSSLGNHHIPGAAQSAFNVVPLPPAAGPLASGAFAATIGTLADNNYTALIQALQTVGKTNLLSAPRITALNNETANILVGTREAYVTTTVTTPGGGSPTTTAEQINFVDVGVKLHVTPTIGEDNYITIKIKPEVSSVDRTLTTSQGNIVPIVRTSQSETSVVVKDGETVVMAGLIEDNKTKSTTGIPYLSRIPLLGIPFRSSSVIVTKTDITVFLTPRIMPDDLTGAQGPDTFSKLPELH